jgi:hypothetical protein
MTAWKPARRDLLRATIASVGVAATGSIGKSADAQQAGPVRWSSGTEPPKLHAPPNPATLYDFPKA